ncbi:hypothetical protein, partial [Cylindrospermopsis raciborskii]|uniref:hypothetical protein n=1 Tax=Cylindrospermopsis raciborskii TaxID=77022 RepID=UPI001C42EFBF
RLNKFSQQFPYLISSSRHILPLQYTLTILLHISLADFDSAQPQELFIQVHFKSKWRLRSTRTREIAS